MPLNRYHPTPGRDVTIYRRVGHVCYPGNAPSAIIENMPITLTHIHGIITKTEGGKKQQNNHFLHTPCYTTPPGVLLHPPLVITNLPSCGRRAQSNKAPPGGGRCVKQSSKQHRKPIHPIGPVAEAECANCKRCGVGAERGPTFHRIASHLHGKS